MKEQNRDTPRSGYARKIGLVGALVATFMSCTSFDTSTNTPSNKSPTNLETIINEEDVTPQIAPYHHQQVLSKAVFGQNSLSHKYLNKYLEAQIPINALSSFENMYERIHIYNDLFDDLENTYDLPRGILAGLAMQESQGFPTKLAYNGDGGAGLLQIQPGVMKDLGKKTWGSSRRVGVDTVNGRELKTLKRDLEDNIVALSVADDRFNPYLNSLAAATHLKTYKESLERRGTYSDKLLIDAYNKGAWSAHLSENSLHVRRTYNYVKQYNEKRSEEDKSRDSLVWKK